MATVTTDTKTIAIMSFPASSLLFNSSISWKPAEKFERTVLQQRHSGKQQMEVAELFTALIILLSFAIADLRVRNLALRLAIYKRTAALFPRRKCCPCHHSTLWGA